MAMLDELLAQLRNPNQTPWQKQMLGQMMGGPFSPSPTNYGDQMGAPGPAVAPQAPAPMGLGGMAPASQAPAVAPPRQPVARFPAPGEGTQNSAPPGPSLGTYMSGALAGASQASNPIGMLLGALGGGMAAGQEVENKRGTYQALADAGMDPSQASLAIKNPDAFKMTQAIREKQEANRKAADETNRTVRFLMKQPGMTEDKARLIASNPAELVPYLKPQETFAARKLQPVGGRLMDITDPANPVDVTPPEKLQERMSFEQNKMDLKTVERYVKDAEDAESMLGDVGGLEAARAETTREGPTFGIIPKDYLPDLSPTAQRIASAAENVRLSFVQKTKGAVSDAEMKVFGMATPTMNMADEAATPIIEFMKLGAKRTQERASFFDTWLRVKGSLKGSQAAWKKFTDENQILVPGKDGTFTLKPENVGSWQAYLDGTAAAPAQSAPAFDYDNATDDEIRAKYRGQ